MNTIFVSDAKLSVSLTYLLALDFGLKADSDITPGEYLSTMLNALHIIYPNSDIWLPSYEAMVQNLLHLASQEYRRNTIAVMLSYTNLNEKQRTALMVNLESSLSLDEVWDNMLEQVKMESLYRINPLKTLHLIKYIAAFSEGNDDHSIAVYKSLLKQMKFGSTHDINR